jgi:GntR family transcriptional regulator, transcriptional repressor for pyruvate dehydrogenase complex
MSRSGDAGMVRRMLLSRQVADELRNMIIRGEYKTGDRLPPIQAMAQSFQVSVSSMRESLRALELAGLLNVKHGKGVFVSDRISFSDDSVSTMLATDTLKLRTVYEARMLVEVGALPMIVERATDAQVAHLRDLVDNLDLGAPASSISKADLEFHIALMETSGNPLLREMLIPLARAISTDIRFLHSLPSELGEFKGWHTRIVEALEARDCDRCQQCMREHLARGLEILTSDVVSATA